MAGNDEMLEDASLRGKQELMLVRFLKCVCLVDPFPRLLVQNAELDCVCICLVDLLVFFYRMLSGIPTSAAALHSSLPADQSMQQVLSLMTTSSDPAIQQQLLTVLSSGSGTYLSAADSTELMDNPMGRKPNPSMSALEPGAGEFFIFNPSLSGPFFVNACGHLSTVSD